MELSFHQKVSWAKKTYCSFPPWEYLSSLEDQKIDEQLNFLSKNVNLYFHFPICPKKCPFCFYPTGNFNELNKGNISFDEFKKKYHELIAEELKIWLTKFTDLEMVESVYIGGGTPSYWFNDEIILNDFLKKLPNIIFGKLKEITFEVHPYFFNSSVLDFLKDKFNSKLKLSLGIQSFQKEYIKIIRGYNDTDTYADTYLKKTNKILQLTKNNKISVNIDLMWGLKDSNIKEDLKYIRNNLINSVDQITFYHIGSPDDYCRENEYRKKIESNFEFIKKQRECIFTEMNQLGFQPDIYIEYFKKKENDITNIYNRGQMEGKDYISCGLGGHGKIGNLVYLNNSYWYSYKKNIDQGYLPIDKFYKLTENDQKIRNLLLKLRIPNSQYTKEDLIFLFKDTEIIKKYFKKSLCKYILNDEGKDNLPELMMLPIETQFKNNKYFQNKELNSILNKIENYFSYNNPDLRQLKHLFELLTFDLFKFFNNFLNNKISTLNFAYFSPIRNIPIFGIPYGSYNENKWKKKYSEWEKSDLEERISLYEIFFRSIKEVGIPYPLIIDKKGINNINGFKNTINKKLKNKDLINKFENVNSVEKIFQLIKIFFGEQNNFLYFLASKNTRSYIGTGGLIFSTEEKLTTNDLYSLAEFLELILNSIMQREYYDSLKKQSLKTAIISILVDSYAHNISAHSLAALKWWIELRHKILNKRFEIRTELENLLPMNVVIKKKPEGETSEIYYKALGKTDSTYNKKYYSLYDFLLFVDNETKNLFSWESKVNQKDGNPFNPRFPVPIDYALYPFFKFLKDKGAFWSGVTRDMAFGGESKTWYKILWEDFANNPLYLGTIARSEGITKMNINLKIKTGEGWKYGRFASIDMSVIDYEEKLSKSSTLKPNEESLNKSEEDNDTYNCIEEDFISYNKYSKYAFLKLGKCFSYFRKLLNDEDEFRVFLPGGIVGEHALFTIFENTIRNIKHYKQSLENIRKEGIDLWISIEKDRLKINKDINNEAELKTNKKLSNITPELFKVGVWLGHETSLIKKEKIKVKNNDGEETENTVEKFLLFEITDQTINPILDESTNTPRMGGNSQDKACAAMLFNNKFNSVENKESDRDKEYFPWIRFSTSSNDKEFELEQKIDTPKEDIKKLELEYKKKYSLNGDQGCLKKYFFLWRGEDVLDKKALIADDWENPARSKLLVSSKNLEVKDIIQARENGIIRLLGNVEDNRNINDLYKQWLEKWIKITFRDGNKDPIGFQRGVEIGSLQSVGAIRLKNNVLCFFQNSAAEKYNAVKVLKLSHGEEKDFHCNIRSHGAFFQNFFKQEFFEGEASIENLASCKINVQSDSKLIGKNEKLRSNETLLCEFIETILSTVVIFDNRVADRFKLFSPEKIKMFKEQLLLEVYKEEENEWNEFINKGNKSVNFLILHLSFIESLGYKEKDLEQFIKNKLSNFGNKENFIFVITSGRGRDEWRESIKSKDYKKSTIFKPIEAILNSIEQGISYNDHFDIKYYLIKTLFGS